MEDEEGLFGCFVASPVMVNGVCLLFAQRRGGPVVNVVANLWCEVSGWWTAFSAV